MNNIKIIVNQLISQDIKNIQSIVDKYQLPLQQIKSIENVPYVAYILEHGMGYVKLKHNNQTKDFKAWAIVLLKRMFDAGRLVNVEDIGFIVDEFFQYKEQNYDEYNKNSFAITSYDTDRGFYHEYLAHIKIFKINE